MIPLLGVALLLLAQVPVEEPRPTSATCVDPEARAKLLSQGPGENRTVALVKERAQQRLAAFNARMDRFQARAKVTEAQVEALMKSWASQAEWVALQNTNGGIVKGFEADMRGLEQAGSERQACLVLIGMFDKLAVIDTNSVRQNELLQAALTAEAKKRGVSLEP